MKVYPALDLLTINNYNSYFLNFAACWNYAILDTETELEPC